MLDYSKLSKSYNELHKKEQENKLKIISSLIQPKQNESLLDIGCGTGISTKPFVKKCKCIGIDNNQEMLSKNKYPHLEADAENLPFKNKTFDYVISVTALHNCKNLKKAITEIRRVIKPNGKIIISFLKRSKKLPEAKKLLKDFSQIEEEKDIIFRNF